MILSKEADSDFIEPDDIGFDDDDDISIEKAKNE